MMNKMKGIVAIVFVLWGMLFALPFAYSETKKTDEQLYMEYLMSKTPADDKFYYYDDIYNPNKIILICKWPSCAKGHFNYDIIIWNRADKMINAGKIEWKPMLYKYDLYNRNKK